MAIAVDVARANAPNRRVFAFPDHSRLRFQYAHALQLTGDSLRGRRELEELIRRAPADPLAKQVRSELERQHRP